jgi:hypothetical protein
LNPEDRPPPQPESELLKRLQDAIKAQLHLEGVEPGTPVTMQRYREALLASPEASELAHTIYELPYVGQKKAEYGLKELAAPETRTNGYAAAQTPKTPMR